MIATRTALALALLAVCTWGDRAAAQSAGTWADVTPAAINLELNGLGNNDNFGIQDVLVDPNNANILYAFTCYQGVWQSTDYGQTWAKVSATGGPMDQGKLWGEAIAPDGSYMLACQGNGPNYTQVFKSTDNGVTWTGYATPVDPYDIDIDPSNVNHVITTGHGLIDLAESTDGGQTWTDQGSMGITSPSTYVHFLNSTTILAVAEGDNGSGSGTWRGVKSGTTWTWTQVSNQQHWHGSHQLFIDSTYSTIYNGGAFGIDASTDNGVTWTTVFSSSNSQQSGEVIGTPSTLYSSSSYPYGNGVYFPNLNQAPRAPGSAWTFETAPTDMTDGAKRYVVTFDGTNYIVVGGNWCAGIWRYVEPAGTGGSPPTVTTPATGPGSPVTGTTAPLTVLGSSSAGPLIYTWSGSGPGTVTFSPNATTGAATTTATFTQAGTYTITVTITDVNGNSTTSSTTVIVNQTLTAIAIAPGTATVQSGGTQPFTATADDQFGMAMSSQPTVTWTVSGGGTISTAGLFTAGTTSGSFGVTAATSGDTSGQASVLITTLNFSNAPTITSVTPSSGDTGTVVIITGTNLGNVTGLTFGSINGSYVSADNGTQITTMVPGGEGSSPITVTTPSGTATAPFTVTTASPPAAAPSSGSSHRCGQGTFSVLSLLSAFGLVCMRRLYGRSPRSQGNQQR
jgi:hypothetical protein